jgi:hypothetical protein
MINVCGASLHVPDQLRRLGVLGAINCDVSACFR